ncbi:phage holin family protein [Deminuibacter soli]|uniref:Phage holin family protein n=1 Tax=Deminuibacter soli TaxID=2291815 RepID=A0A3E1NQN1_9BACT|nr:phage holin family protein [Deminuibacter soli]RFM30233.1 phage holin family protein [Deminuibacter soli]
MGKFIGKILVTALAALIVSYLMPGVRIDSGTSAVLLALVLALLNGFVKPVLIILTIPITLVTFGLFLLIINMVIIKWSSDIVGGFHIAGWWAAFWFSILLSVVTFFLESIISRQTREPEQ